jgi:sulfite exporter TauE/SafE
VVTQAVTTPDTRALQTTARVIAYNAGRIGSYSMAGAIAGGIVGSASTLVNVSAIQLVGLWLANLMLVALGLYLMDAWRGLTQLEKGGQMLWRHIQPLLKHFLPLDNSFKMLAAGALWGWLPCGMVYSMLMTAMLSGSASSGALVMLAFGLGTLPTLFTIGVFGMRMKSCMQRPLVRQISGVVVLGFGLLGLLRATNGLPASWMDTLCITPHGSAVQP